MIIHLCVPRSRIKRISRSMCTAALVLRVYCETFFMATFLLVRESFAEHTTPYAPVPKHLCAFDHIDYSNMMERFSRSNQSVTLSLYIFFEKRMGPQRPCERGHTHDVSNRSSVCYTDALDFLEYNVKSLPTYDFEKLL